MLLIFFTLPKMFNMELGLWEVLFLKAGATYLYVGTFPDT